MRTLVRWPDQQPAVQPGNRVLSPNCEIGGAIGDPEHCPERAQQLRDPDEAVVDENVRKPGQLLHLIGIGRALGRDAAGVDDHIGVQLLRGRGHIGRGAVGLPADHRHPRESWRQISATRLPTEAGEFGRRQHQDQNLRRRVGGHDPPDTVGDHDAPAGGIHEFGRTRGYGRQRKQQQGRAEAFSGKRRGR